MPKIPLDIVTKQFFSWRMIFFLHQEHISYCKKKILCQEKNLVTRKEILGPKNVVKKCHFIKRIFFCVLEKKICELRLPLVIPVIS